jgi:hypothetical protein
MPHFHFSHSDSLSNYKVKIIQRKPTKKHIQVSFLIKKEWTSMFSGILQDATETGNIYSSLLQLKYSFSVQPSR